MKRFNDYAVWRRTKQRNKYSFGKRSYAVKLLCVVALLAMSSAMAAVCTYAWMTLSSNPVVDGITVILSGRDTIQIAADETKTVNGSEYHYPSSFGDTLSLTGGGYILTPVSTADGVNWFQAVYNESDDADNPGALSSFESANGLMFDGSDTDSYNSDGGFAYYDFWVLSPGAEYNLRVSVGDESSEDGSYVLSLPQTDETGAFDYELNSAAAAIRVGFLVSDAVDNDAATYYFEEISDDTRVTALTGNSDDWADSTFTIYEPNSDWHDPTQASYIYSADGVQIRWYENGSYAATYAVTSTNGDTKDVTSITSAQKSNVWRENANGVSLEEQYEAYTYLNSAASIVDFANYFQNQLDAYVTRGRFFKYTNGNEDNVGLTQLLDVSDVIGADIADMLNESTATEDIMITTIEPKTAQRIRMFIWLEGQDVDCVNEDCSAELLVRLEFAGES